MTMKRWILTLTTLALLLPMGAGAENTLYACRENGALRIEWSAQGECELTVYCDGWPVSVRTVDGAAGGTTVPVSGAGKYSVRLKSAEGCLKVNAADCGAEEVQPTTAPEETATPQPTATPEESCVTETTCAPEATAAPDVTKKPEATAAPAAANPVKPTDAPEATAAPKATDAPIPTAIPAAAPVSSGSSMSAMAAEVAAQVNAERAKYGLSSLTVSDELTRAACVRASEIVRQFSHTRPDGSSCFTVSGTAYGENIAKGQSSADRVMAAWMSSEGHRANILRESYGSIGVCALKVNGVIYWVQLFGK